MKVLKRIRVALAAFRQYPRITYSGVAYVPSFMPQNAIVVIELDGPLTLRVQLSKPVSHAPTGAGCQGYTINGTFAATRPGEYVKLSDVKELADQVLNKARATGASDGR